MHAFIQLMVENPPKGYEYIFRTDEKKVNKLNSLKQSKILTWLYRTFLKKTIRSKIYDKVYSIQPPEDADLIFTGLRALEIKKPWFSYIFDTPLGLAGFDYNNFIKEKNKIEKKFLSPYCRKILVSNQTEFETIKKFFSPELIKKCEVVNASVKKQNLSKKKHSGINLLFMGSLANPNDYYLKGMIEIFETFKSISKEFPNVNLIIKCKVPEHLKQKYKDIKNIKIIDYRLSDQEIQNLYLNTDIYFKPGHSYDLMSTLEALSFGLPFVALDTYGMKDYVKNRKNGFLIKPSDKISAYTHPGYPSGILRDRKFINEVSNPDPRVISDLAKALKSLITNKKLRETMGDESKKIADDEFSLEQMNKKLKKIFDQITT